MAIAFGAAGYLGPPLADDGWERRDLTEAKSSSAGGCTLRAWN